MNILVYIIVFFAALLVDVIPFIGPPAWTVMVFCQLQFGLDIWPVLFVGVTGSAIGRYIYSRYVPFISDRFIKPSKNTDIQFIGQRFANFGWKVQLFVLFYTLMPLPSTPLFTAAGIARVKTIRILPAFFAGKFTSDAVMVMAGNYVAAKASNISQDLFTWKSLTGILAGVLLMAFFLFIDWKKLLMEKKLRFTFNIWK